MLTLCDNCPKKWECEDPCAEAISWIDLPAEFRIKDKDYTPKGVAMVSYAESRLLKNIRMEENE